MKKFALVISLLTLSFTAIAEEFVDYSNLTLAAVESSTTESWTFEKSERKLEVRHSEVLAEKLDSMSQKLNAKLQQRLQEKFDRQFAF